MNIPKFISVDSTLNSLKVTSNILPKTNILVKNYLKSDNFSSDFKKILKNNSITFDKVKLLLINLGPGSYAGIRNVLACIKLISYLKSIKIAGFSNYDLMKILKKNKKEKYKIILFANKKFYLSKNKIITREQFETLIKKEKVISNFEHEFTKKNNNILPFFYNSRDIEELLMKRLHIMDKIVLHY